MIFNKLSSLFSNIDNGATITLEKNEIYDVYEEDSFILEGYFCSNSAKINENPLGLRKSAIFIKGKRDITIDGNGAMILVHGKMTPILLDECNNVVIKNLKIDYACPTMTEFKILSDNGGICELLINDDCRYEIRDNKLFWSGEKNIKGKPYWIDEASQQGRYCKILNPETNIASDFSREHLKFSKIEEIEKNHLRVTLENRDAPLIQGFIIQTRSIVRDQVGSFFHRCSDIRFENLRVMFMHGLGMVSQFSENITFKECNFTPKENRTIASTADFFQFSGCKGQILIENCKAQGAHDDYINVHGTHLRIIGSEPEENKITVKFMHPETWGFKAFDKNDEIEFIKWNSLQPYSNAKVIDYNKINNTESELILDRALPEIEIGKDVVENVTCTPALTVKGCSFGPTSGRGILATTRKKVIIENNVFEKIWGPVLLIEDDCNFWFESGYTTEIVFRNNVVSQCECGKMYPGGTVIRCDPKVMDDSSEEFVHKSITIESNIFKLPPFEKHCFYLSSLENATVRNNIFDAPLEIISDNVGNLQKENNIIK